MKLCTSFAEWVHEVRQRWRDSEPITKLDFARFKQETRECFLAVAAMRRFVSTLEGRINAHATVLEILLSETPKVPKRRIAKPKRTRKR